MHLICPKCSTRNRSLAKFCMKCVTSLSTTFVERKEDVLADTLAEIGHSRTLRVPRTAEWAAEGDAQQVVRSDLGEFAEHALPDGTLIEGFRIVRSIGEGGFGIVYLAWDAALERHVAIKEYMPTSLAVRGNPSLEVSMRSDRHRGTFDAGLKSFVNEARLLARFDHPALVKVFRFWEGNRTAYMAMPFYEGPTLKATLAAAGNTVSEPQLRAWMDPLLDALTVLHREHCYHRDISPDNILLTTAGPVLLDFGAARRVISDMTQALTAVLKPGFAPIEQYGGELQQGPWTDLYALAGVVHYAITGRAPTASVVRVVSDTLQPLAVTQAGKYSDSFLRAIDAALSVRPEARPQDVAAFRALLDAGKTDAVAAPPNAPPQADAPTNQSTDKAAQVSIDESPNFSARLPEADLPQLAQPATAASTPVTAAASTPVTSPFTSPFTSPVTAPVTDPVTDPATKRSNSRIYVATTACLLLIGGATFWALQGSGARLPDVGTPTAAVAIAPTPPTPSTPLTTVAPAAVEAGGAGAVVAAQEPALATSVTATLVAATPVALTASLPVAMPAAPRPAVRTLPPAVAERKKPATVLAAVDEARTASRTDAEAEPASPRKTAARPQRCADIIQKSSLDTLNPEEVAYLKKECR
ncbi:hypothetical protein BH11PSE13_BH11PSE13_06350 [soil metagenome]